MSSLARARAATTATQYTVLSRIPGGLMFGGTHLRRGHPRRPLAPALPLTGTVLVWLGAAMWRTSHR